MSFIELRPVFELLKAFRELFISPIKSRIKVINFELSEQCYFFDNFVRYSNNFNFTSRIIKNSNHQTLISINSFSRNFS